MSRTKSPPTKQKVDPKPRPRPDDEEPRDEIADEPTPDEVEQEERLDLFRSQFSGRQFKIRVERLNVETSEWEWVERLPFDGFDPFNLAKRFGSGRYVCILLDEGGKYVKGGRMEFRFAGAPAPIEPEQKPDPAAAMMTVLLEQQKSQTVMLAEMLKAALSAPKSDISQIVTAMQGINAMQPKPDTGGGMKNLQETLGLVATIRDLFDNDRGGDKENPGILSELKEAFKMVMDARGIDPRTPTPALPGRSVRPVNGAPIVRAPLKPTLAALPTEPKEIPMTKYEERIRKHIPTFVEFAAENGDVEQWANYLITILDTQIIPALVEHFGGFVDADGVWERLIEAAQDIHKREKVFDYVPELVPYRDWTMNVILRAVAIETGNETDAVAPPDDEPTGPIEDDSIFADGPSPDGPLPDASDEPPISNAPTNGHLIVDDPIARE